MRQILAVFVAALGVLGACSRTDRPPIERVSGNIGASDGTASVAGDRGGTVPTGGSGRLAAGPTTTGGVDGSEAGAAGGSGSSASSGTSGTGSSTDTAVRNQAATAALDAYFEALKAEDFAGAQRVSTGGAAFMARVRDLVSRYNKERNGVTTLSYSTRSFQVASSTASKVTFSGQAKLDSTTSGPAGPPQKESTLFENPAVTFSSGAWRVVDYDCNGQPLGYFPATSHETVGGVDLRLPGALAFGRSTGLIIDLVSDGNHSIKVDKATLHYADGSTASPKLAALISAKPAALYFLFDRASTKPTSWTATVTIDGGTSKAATANVVLSF